MSEKLNILWTNDNAELAHSMVFMYAINSKINNWWDEVNIIIWGPTARLVATNEVVQEKIKMALHAGISIQACEACANQFGVAEDLRKLDIDVRFMGEPLTNILKTNEKLITI